MKNKVELYAIRDDGRKFAYNNADWGLLKLTGVDFSAIETFTMPRGAGDGDLITGQRRKSREISLETHFRDNEKVAEARKNAIAFHDIKHIYDIHIVYLGVHRIAKACRIKAASYPTENIHRSKNLVLSFLSSDPDLFGENAVEEVMIERSARWALARYYTDEHKLLYATETQATDKVIIYEGANPAPIKIEIKAYGYCLNPTIQVGEISCTISAALKSGDILIIDSEVAFATLNNEMIPYVATGNFDMRQFRVFNGENRIKIKAEQGDAFRTSITYTGRYNGV